MHDAKPTANRAPYQQDPQQTELAKAFWITYLCNKACRHIHSAGRTAVCSRKQNIDYIWAEAEEQNSELKWALLLSAAETDCTPYNRRL